MSEIFFTSDTHYGHENLVMKFKDKDGVRARINPSTNSPFESLEEHDEYLIEQHNKVVSVNDKVYHGGDFAFNINVIKRILPRLNGRIKIMLGNHDPIDSMINSGKLFKSVRYWRFFNSSNSPISNENSFLLSHVPVPHQEFKHRVNYNVHGHTHHHLMMTDSNEIDKAYVNICVEKTNYSPIHIEELQSKFKPYKGQQK